MNLVEVHCKRCGTGGVLAVVNARPADTTRPLRVPPCAKHDRPRPGEFFRWARGAALRGEKPHLTLWHEIEWPELLALIERAGASGRTMHTAV